MAKQMEGAGSGCSWLFGLVVLVIGLAYWQVALMAGLVIALVGSYLASLLHLAHQRFGAQLAAAANRWQGAPCQLNGSLGVMGEIALVGTTLAPRIRVRCDLFVSQEQVVEVAGQTRLLEPPADRSTLATARGLERFLRSQGIELLAPLSVEARAVTAAAECLRERDWSREALGRIRELRSSLRKTLAKAAGNELLEPAIPQLREALQACDTQESQLREAERGSALLLRKLIDFLNVPEAVRPILNFELEPFENRQRFADLESSFQDVVLLNEAFRELSRDALA